MEDSTLNLITREGTKFPISQKILEFSNFLKTTVEDGNDEDIPVDISTYSMGKIKEFFEHHEYKEIKPIRKPIKTSNYTTITSEWDNNFFTNMDEDQISDLVMGAGYLQCDILFDYCLAFIASQFKDITPDDIKRKYNVTEEITEELEEKIKAEHPYIFRDLLPEN